MAFYTTQYLSDQLGRELQDPDLTNWKLEERVDYINRSIRFVQNVLVSMNRSLTIPEYYPYFKITYTDINKDGFADLPDNFEIPVQFKLWSENSKEIHIVSEDKLFEELPEFQHRCCIIGDKSSAALPNIANSGNTDFTRFGNFIGTNTHAMSVTIDPSGTEFTWTGNTGAPAVPITGDWQTLEEGIEIKIENAVAGDSWSWTCNEDAVKQLVRFNFQPAEDIKVTFAERLANLTDISGAQYLPFERYYDIIYYMVLLLCRNRNEESLNMDMAVYQPVISRIRTFGHIMNNDKEFKIKTSEQSRKYI